jgi:hypothetical protein
LLQVDFNLVDKTRFMIKNLLPIFIVVSFSSCSHYQYATLSAENIPKDDKKNEFVAESDTLRIVYNFNGKKGPVSITIFNKSDMPLQVDWKKSALIIDDKPIAYYQPDWNINGSISTSPGILTTSSSTLQANVTGREGLEFLPPHSFISRKGSVIKNNNDFFAMPADVVNEKIKVQGFSKKMVKGFFTKENSPFVFRNYLTFIYVGNSEKIFSVDHSFYVSQLLETYAGPELLWPDSQKPGNTFFLSVL